MTSCYLIINEGLTGQHNDEAEWFVSHIAPNIVGKTKWKDDVKSKLISEILSPTDEAYGILVLENKYKYWMYNYNVEVGREHITSPKKTPKFTTSKSRTENGKGRYEGWTEEGINQYNVLVKRARMNRLSEIRKE